METTEVIIARLVLGYLKEEKCRSAYKEFLITSRHLECDLGTKTKSKYLPTRFVGLTLADILCEYFEVSKIVQGRLEATNYYNECHSRSSLVQQLLYLLNKNPSSRTSTPCPRSPLESHLDETSPSHIDHGSDVETTPAHTLPGNIRCTSEDSYLYKTPRRKSNSKLNKSATVANVPVTEREDNMSEVLASTLLENKEFHEKIAQTINKVAEKQYRVSSELDHTVRTVVQETEADPIFDKILEEIIGSTSAIENCKGVDTSSTTSSTAKDMRDNSRNKSKRAQKRLSSHSEDDFDERIRTHPEQTVEQQNDEAIRSIIATNSNVTSNALENQDMHVNNEVTVFNGSLDKYLTSNTCNAITQTQPLQNPLYINTSSTLVMVPSGIPSNTNLQIDSTKQYYLVNKQPAMNWINPSLQSTNIITEQDILAMPTVIVSEERHNQIPTAQPSLQTPILTTTSRLPAIIPKPTIEIAPEYVRAYESMDCLQQTGLKKVIYPKTTKKPKANEKIAEAASCQTEVEPRVADIPKVEKSLPADLDKDNEEDKPTTSSQAIAKPNSGHSTPPPVTEHVQKKTPKSGSHVRNLDFSTPPKMTSTQRKSVKQSRAFVHKKQAAKSLFESKNDANDILQTVKAQRQRTWDSDLRANIVLSDEEKPVRKPSKRKKRTPIKKLKKKVSKGKGGRQRLNTTEQDAARIEAALHTPIKIEYGESIKSDPENDECKRENHDTDSNEGKFSNNVNSDTDTVTECKPRPKKSTDYEVKESTEFNTNKTVLSPSKLNANKRNFIRSDVTDTDTASDPTKSVVEANKFVTPEMAKENFHYPIKANRNITHMFETPLKNDFIPKTPGSPSASLNTPFTRMLEANLKGIDISSLPTPNIPVTPSFPPFTPNIQISSPYSNRPTDYSTSSSYYQPSDSEPNRSLEANVIELEKQTVNVLSDITVTKSAVIEDEDSVKPVSHIVDERLKIFNGNVIGKKNLSLVKRNVSSNSSSCDSSSESSNEEDVDTCSWVDKSNDTVVYNKKAPETPKRVYALRNRTTSVNKKEDEKLIEVKENSRQGNRNAKTNIKPSNSVHKPEKAPECEKSLGAEINCKDDDAKKGESVETIMENDILREKLRKELKGKLSRTMNRIKTIERQKDVKKTTKSSKSSFMKIKILSKNKRRKSGGSPKKIEKKIIDEESKLEDTDAGDHILQLKVKRKENNDTKHTKVSKNQEKIDKSASDIEAQNLIEGLKERGIHLMKNESSPSKKTNGTSNFSELDKDLNNESSALKPNTKKNAEENPHETSTSELQTEWRETYDTMEFKDHECVTFSETKKTTKSFESYNLKVLEKTFIGKVFIEELNKEIEIPLEVTPFHTLLDIPSSINTQQKEKGVNKKIKMGDKKAEEKSPNRDPAVKTEPIETSTCLPQNSVGDHHALSVATKEDTDEPGAPSLKKRKLKEESGVPEDKKCTNLLRQINVDTFLNNIYGNS